MKSWVERVQWPPKSSDPLVGACRKEVEAARQEFDLAVSFHELWKPAAYDAELHKRMGTSYASNAFLVVRSALRREMLLALMRLWDKTRGSIRLDNIARALRQPHVIDELVTERIPLNLLEASDQIRMALMQTRDAVLTVIEKYCPGGSHWHVRQHLQSLRHERLAHRRIQEIGAKLKADTDDDEIEYFYNDMIILIKYLMDIFLATAYNPSDTADVYRHHAQFFWAGVRGERTEDHPNYKSMR